MLPPVETGVAMERRRAELLALCAIPGIDWSLVAREAQRPRGLERLLRGEVSESTRDAKRVAALVLSTPPDVSAMALQLEGWLSQGLSLVTCLDATYPVNLRRIHNLPPFLFVRGKLRPDDAYAVAVVGTRRASAEGLRRARRMATGLANAGVTVVSGLARGIDTAAHEATLDAGGRTIAVLGSGLLKMYPPENDGLAARISESGAVVSQFFPSSPPTKFSFAIRNVVTSGLGQGTVVIEASATSGAKMQARLALQHGKQVFLLASLVRGYEWAERYSRRGATVVSDVRDVVRRLQPPEDVEKSTAHLRQLSLSFA
jgi:DNA processing protein